MIPYIINVGLILMGCLAFYKLLLQKETFYSLNRYLLVLCLLISFLLPLLHIPQQFSLRRKDVVTLNTNNNTAINENGLPTIINLNNHDTIQPKKSKLAVNKVNTAIAFSWQQLLQWIVWLYWFGVIVFVLNFITQTIMLLYRAYTNPVINDGRFRIVEVKGNKAPCSFLNNIFINPEQYEWDVYKQVLEHEKIHVQQRHSLDILMAELLIIFQWFNPFAWQYRKEIENNLEFLTDHQMVQQQHVEKANYQMNLLKVSAPHFPLSLTTNYNQSLLKKRIAMMNAKKSSVQTTWKYFFLLPLLLLLASILNEPVAIAQYSATAKSEKRIAHADSSIQNEGYWFATIRGNKINLSLTQYENDNRSESSSEFLLSDFPNLPTRAKGDFKLIREAGTMDFNGQFDSNQGMGKYTFVPDVTFKKIMSAQGVGKIDDNDLMSFFFWNITKEYLQMLKDEGCTNIQKGNLVALKVFGIDKAFIDPIKENGIKNINVDKLLTLKNFGITGAYIKEIKAAGYKDITVDQLITFKVQGINKTNLAKLKKSNKSDSLSADDILNLMSNNEDAAYAESFKAVGFENIEPGTLMGMKVMGVTPGYIKQFQAIGYKNITADQSASMKMWGVTPEDAKQFAAIGYKNIPADQFTSIKEYHITPEFVDSFKELGYPNIEVKKLVKLKILGVQPGYIKSLKDKGYKNISLDDAISLKMQNTIP